MSSFHPLNLRSRLGFDTHRQWWLLAGTAAAIGLFSYALTVSDLLIPLRIVIPIQKSWYPLFGLTSLVLFLIGSMMVSYTRLVSYPVYWFSIFFITRFAVASVYPWLNQFDDERGFYNTAIAQSEDRFFVIGQQLSMYFFWVTSWFEERNFLITRTLPMFLGSILPFLFVSSFQRATDAASKDRTLVFQTLAWLPPLFTLSIVADKTIPSLVGMSLAIWAGATWYKNRWQAVMALVSAIIVLLGFRGEVIALLPLVIFAPIWAMEFLWFFRTNSRRGKIVFCIVGLCILLLVLVMGYYAYNAYLDRIAGAGHAIRFRGDQSTIKQYLEISDGFSFTFKNVLLLMGRGFISPPPFKVFERLTHTNLHETFVMLTWIGLLPVSLIGVFAGRIRRDLSHGLGLSVIAIVAMASLSPHLGGDLVRHRVIAFAPLLMLAFGAMDGRSIFRFRYVIVVWWLTMIAFWGFWGHAKGLW